MSQSLCLLYITTLAFAILSFCECQKTSFGSFSIVEVREGLVFPSPRQSTIIHHSTSQVLSHMTFVVRTLSDSGIDLCYICSAEDCQMY